MAITEASVSLSEESLHAIQSHLRELELDGWLLYDFRGINPIATGILGLPALSRRFFVLLPARGRPVAVTHRIEQQPWHGWIGENRPYLSWESFEKECGRLLEGVNVVALEYSEGDAVPYLDRLPAGILELVRASGVRVASSGNLVSAFYSRWSAEGRSSHERAAAILRETALGAFDRIGDQLRAGEAITEWEMRKWITTRLTAHGLTIGADSVVAINANAANPHYAPSSADHGSIRPGDLVLVDLWGKENDDSIYADQTWMAFVGSRVPERIEILWCAIRDARNAAVDLIRERCNGRQPVAGYEVDDVARGVIVARGLGDAFIHRTGHSIDRELHGSGPNVDNLESRDTRRLIPGIGFSIEPGVYLPGDVGLRTEIDVFMTEEGPVVTTPQPQEWIHLIQA